MIVSFFIIYLLKLYADNGLPDVVDCEDVDVIEESQYDSASQFDKDCFCSDKGFFQIMGKSNIYLKCKSFFWNTIWRFLLTIAISIAIAVINFIIELSIRKFANFERYKNKTAMQKSIMTKLTIATFINAGLLIVLTNADMTWLGISKDLSGKFTNTNRRWMYIVGVPIITIIIVDIIMLGVKLLLDKVIFKVKQVVLRGRQVL